MERVFLESLEPSHCYTTEHTRQTFGGGKYHRCSWSFPRCQNTEGWEGCRLWWNPTWNAQSLESRSSLADSYMSSDL